MTFEEYRDYLNSLSDNDLFYMNEFIIMLSHCLNVINPEIVYQYTAFLKDTNRIAIDNVNVFNHEFSFSLYDYCRKDEMLDNIPDKNEFYYRNLDKFKHYQNIPNQDKNVLVDVPFLKFLMNDFKNEIIYEYDSLYKKIIPVQLTTEINFDRPYYQCECDFMDSGETPDEMLFLRVDCHSPETINYLIEKYENIKYEH